MRKARVQMIRNEIRGIYEEKVAKMTDRKVKVELRKRGLQDKPENERETLIEMLVDQDMG